MKSPPGERSIGYSLEHPAGEFAVRLELAIQIGTIQIGKSGVIRTARLLCRGEVLVPLDYQV
jgi:4-oxalomesaconate tautomerase